MTQSIPIGMSVTLDQNVTYALPAKPVYLQTVQGGTQHSPDGVNWFSTASGTVLASKFLRSTIVGSTVLLLSADKAPGSDTVSGSGSFQNFIAVGANPAQSGAIRLANGGDIRVKYSDGNDYHLLGFIGNAPRLGNASFGTYIDANQTINMIKDVAIGTNPAQSGAIRLANNQHIMMRNGANTGDLRLASSFGNRIYLGGGGEDGITMAGPMFDIQGSYITLGERVTPTAPAAN